MKSQPDSTIKVVFLVVTFLIIALSITQVLNQNPTLRIRSDFFVRWYSALKLFEEKRNVYDPANGTEVDRIIYGGDNDNISLDFYYPAHILIFIAPLSKLDYKTAHFIWTFFTQILLLFALSVMIKPSSWQISVEKASTYIFLIFISYPMLLHTYWGQFNTIGVCALALTYYFLQKTNFACAGISAAGLTFKPHPYAALIIFILLWVQSNPLRSRFNISFILSIVCCWGVAELLQPGWSISFIESLGRYPTMRSVVDSILNPYQIVASCIFALMLIIFFLNRKVKIDSAQFCGCLVISMSLWALIFPFILTFHVFGLALVQIALLATYKRYLPKYYLNLITLLILIYCLGWVGAKLDLFNNEWFIWTQVVYKLIYPIALTLVALPLCFFDQIAKPESLRPS